MAGNFSKGCAGLIVTGLLLCVVNLVLYVGQRMIHKGDFAKIEADDAYLAAHNRSKIEAMIKPIKEARARIAFTDIRIISMAMIPEGSASDPEKDIDEAAHDFINSIRGNKPSQDGKHKDAGETKLAEAMDEATNDLLSNGIESSLDVWQKGVVPLPDRWTKRLTISQRLQKIEKDQKFRAGLKLRAYAQEAAYRDAVEGYNSKVTEVKELADKTAIYLLWPKPIATAIEIYSTIADPSSIDISDELKDHLLEERVDHALEEMEDHASSH